MPLLTGSTACSPNIYLSETLAWRLVIRLWDLGPPVILVSLCHPGVRCICVLFRGCKLDNGWFLWCVWRKNIDRNKSMAFCGENPDVSPLQGCQTGKAACGSPLQPSQSVVPGLSLISHAPRQHVVWNPRDQLHRLLCPSSPSSGSPATQWFSV